jgi:hypothetical protein
MDKSRTRRLYWTTGVALAGLVLAAMPVSGAKANDASRIAALKAKIARLSKEAELIDDANKISNLQMAYGYYLDRGYWDEAADLFAADATVEMGDDGVYVGQDRIRKLIIAYGGGNPGPGLPYGQYNHHMQLQPVIDVAPDGMTAKARWREFSLLGQFHKYAKWAAGIFENTYVKQDGVWKIKTMHYYQTFVADYKGGWASLKPVSGDWKSDVAKEMPADGPPTTNYKPFPDIYVPPFHYKNPVTGK